jgi:4-hydroxy-2-oxoheptanedioate aldolase
MARPWLTGPGVALGGWCSLPSSYATEIVARAGFDWICVDMQHGLFDLSAAVAMLQATSASSIPTLIRVPSAEPAGIGKVLDAGADGVIVPFVDTPELARQAVLACRYPPEGVRSWGPARAQLTADSYSVESANANVLCVVQIESTEAVKNLDEIMQVPGVDAILVGPSDLAISLGMTPTLGPVPGEHSRIIAAIAESAAKHGMPCAIYCGTEAATRQFYDLGYRILASFGDALNLRLAAAESVARLRHDLGGRTLHISEETDSR